MIEEKLFLGLPLDFNGKCRVYPPLVRDVVGNDHYGQYQRLLTISQEDIEDEMVKTSEGGRPQNIPTPLEFLLSNAFYSKEFYDVAVGAFEFFIHESVSFLYERKLVLIGDIKEALTKAESIDDLVFLSEDDYFDFQNTVRRACGMMVVEKPNPDEPERLRIMKAKARYRDRIKAKQGNGLSLHSLMNAICCMDMGVTPLNVGQLPYAALNSLVDVYQRKEKYELDTRAMLAGAKKVHPVYWIK